MATLVLSKLAIFPMLAFLGTFSVLVWGPLRNSLRPETYCCSFFLFNLTSVVVSTVLSDCSI